MALAIRKRSKKKQTLSIIVPVYNEEKTVLALLGKVRSVRLKGLEKQIIIVNDGSSDNTRGFLKKIKYPGVSILHHEKNQEKGSSIRTAIPHTTGDYVV